VFAVSATAFELTTPRLYTGPSDDLRSYPVIADPPFDGVPQLTSS
jgi:hypothetical protein